MDKTTLTRCVHERHSKFRGTARVKLACLRLDDPSTEQKQFLHPKNVKRLKEIYAVEGCKRLVPEHHVPALISSQELAAPIRRSETSQAALFHCADDEPPELRLPFEHLTFLHGRHRLEAARGFLSDGDDWWTVDLYLDGMTTFFFLQLT